MMKTYYGIVDEYGFLLQERDIDGEDIPPFRHNVVRFFFEAGDIADAMKKAPDALARTLSETQNIMKGVA